MDNTVELTNQSAPTLAYAETRQNEVSRKSSAVAILTQNTEGSFYSKESIFTSGTEDATAATNNITHQAVSSFVRPIPEPTVNLRSVASTYLNLGLPYPKDKNFDPYGVDKPMSDDDDDNDDGEVGGWILALPAPVRAVAVDKNGIDLGLKL